MVERKDPQAEEYELGWCPDCGDPEKVCEALGGCDPEGVTYL
jgi:hypothetical protein